MASGLTVHKAFTDPTSRRVYSLCEPGYFQIADNWNEVSCERCWTRKPKPEEEPDPQEAKMLRLISAMTVEMGRFPTEQEVIGYIFGDDEERKVILHG